MSSQSHSPWTYIFLFLCFKRWRRGAVRGSALARLGARLMVCEFAVLLGLVLLRGRCSRSSSTPRPCQ